MTHSLASPHSKLPGAHHVHIIVEAAEKDALGRGMKAVASRLARAVNRVFGRSGAVMDGRYHLRVLGSPREVRNAIAYVLLNSRKHWRERWGQAPPVRIDAASSGRWFGGWLSEAPTGDESPGPCEVSNARSWLLRAGWKMWGLIDPAEVPGTRNRSLGVCAVERGSAAYFRRSVSSPPG